MTLTRYAFLIPAMILGMPLCGFAQSEKPVFHVSSSQPTGDKPQSKLWYSQGRWWALLPHKNGQSLWERTDAGWREHTETTKQLKGFRGRCDVWPEADHATVVATDQKAIHVFRLADRQGWTGETLATLALPEGKTGTMTATIARDDGGQWWIAADVGGCIAVWNSEDAITWSPPTVLSAEVKEKEDLCLVTKLPGGVGVIWTDQIKDRVVIREHVDGAPWDQWMPETIIEQGGGAADNHLKAALAADGTLWLATKNSLDKIGEPQLVLRIRSAQGTWRNYPYAPRQPDREPSRPAVYLTPDPNVVLLGHNVYNRSDNFQSSIDFGLADPGAPEVLKHERPVILPAKEVNAKYVRNITGPKLPFPADAPWIILAADGQGRIFEADLKAILPNP